MTRLCRLPIRVLICVLAMAGAAPVVGHAADGDFPAKVSAYSADGQFVADQILTCPGSPACSFHFEVPFEERLWSMTVMIKQGGPGTLSAWVTGGPIGSWGSPGGYREFRADADVPVELMARSIDHRLAESPVEASVPVAEVRIQVL